MAARPGPGEATLTFVATTESDHRDWQVTIASPAPSALVRSGATPLAETRELTARFTVFDLGHTLATTNAQTHEHFQRRQNLQRISREDL